ncbi:MAG TPA: type II secretion system F family protein [Acidimicrobiia bacterium]|nr:type II secretion system F family protein [Acidimicrobiia bacterium]
MLEMPPYVYACVGSMVLSVPLLWWSVAARKDPVSQLVRENLGVRAPVSADVREVELTQSAKDRIVEPILGGVTSLARRFLPASIGAALEQRIAMAGMTGRWPVERLLAVKLLLGLAGFLLALLYLAGNASAAGLFIAALIPLLTYRTPDVILSQRAKTRQEEILKKLPDTLDEITISVEAGLGFEAAIAEAGRSGSGALAEELIRTLQDIQIGVPRAQAMTDLVMRTEVADLRHFVIAVRQAEQYGVPIAQVLRVQSKEMRERRKQRAEERAMKMPVKILIPTVFFILPALFIVILGPAVLRLVDSLGS